MIEVVALLNDGRSVEVVRQSNGGQQVTVFADQTVKTRVRSYYYYYYYYGGGETTANKTLLELPLDGRMEVSECRVGVGVDHARVHVLLVVVGEPFVLVQQTVLQHVVRA